MPSFQQYTNAVQPVTGMAEAGANIGKFYQQGLQNFGQSIAQGLQTYNENKSMNEFLDQKAQVLGQQIMQFHDMYAKNPEMKDFADSLLPYADTIAKTSGMSLSQKKGAIAEVEHGFSNIGTQLQAFMQNKDMMLRQATAAAGNVVKQNTMEASPAIVEEGLNRLDPNKTAAQNTIEFRNTLEQMKAHGAEIDIPDIIQRWQKAAPTRIDQANFDSKGVFINPDIKAAFKKQFENQVAIDENQQTDESGVTDYAKEAEMYGSVSSDVINQLNAQVKPDKKSATNFASPLLEKLAKNQAASGASMSSGLLDTGKKVTTDVISAINEKVNNGEPITPDMIRDFAKKSESQNNPYQGVNLPQFSGMAPSSMGAGYARYSEQKTKFTTPSPAISAVDDALSKVNAGSSQQLTPMALKSIVDNIGGNISKFDEASKRMADTAKNIAAGAEPEKPKYSQAPIPQGAFSAGTIQKESSYVDYEKMKRDTMNFVAQRMGYKDANGNTVIPAGFEDAFNKLHPEASLKVVNTPYGAMMWNGKDWNQLKQEKGMNTEDMRKQSRGIYGVQTENGLAFAPAFDGSKIKLAGVFTGTDNELEHFKTKIESTERIMNAAKDLNEVLDVPFHSLLPSQISKAQSAMTILTSALQPELFHGARYGEWEQKILNEIKPNPNSWYQLDDVTKDRIKMIYKNAVNAVKMNAGLNGLAIRITDSNSAEQILAAARAAKPR